jgi:selenide, water dikinase
MLEGKLLLGFDTADDAAIYQINEEVAAVLTLDFFTPVVDDPYDFGCVAAANALSDVFAMGGKVQVAMNILAFPKSVGTEVVGEVLRGGADKVKEAGGVICGGHTIEDDEPKYGLSVFGTVNPKQVVKNEGSKVGDILYYTKKIGTGIQNSAFKAGLIGDEEMSEVIKYMKELNKAGAEAMIAAGADAGTDVTGFGIAGHLHEMLEPSKVGAEIYWDKLPLYDRTYEFSELYCRPGKTDGIIEFASEFVEKGDLEEDEYDDHMGVLCDPQTSGGIMCAIPPQNQSLFEKEFEERCGFKPWLIGKITDDKTSKIKIIKNK